MANDQQMRLKNQKHHQSSLDKSLRPPKKEESSPVGPWLIGVFLFVILGSTIFQMINTGASTDDIMI